MRITCEECGRERRPEEIVMFQGEVALCWDEADCKEWQRENGLGSA